MRTKNIVVHRNDAEDWRVSLIDTGDETMTGGRIKRILRYIGDDEAFCMTYGDGVGDIDVGATLAFHRRHGRMATVTAYRQPNRFGEMALDEDRVQRFVEKPQGEGGWINCGFFVLSPQVGRYVEGDETIWERAPLESLSRDDELRAFKHGGFWHPMDTLRDKNALEELWRGGQAPWKIWR
jgi:glucose-1-phosphate cytidylyltransferase